MLTTIQYQNINIDSIEDGRHRIAEIEQEMRELLLQMRETDDNPTFDQLSRERYELKKAKRHIQQLMGKIVAARHKRWTSFTNSKS